MTDDELIEHLTRTRIAGNVATSRQNNLDNIGKMIGGDPDYHFGVTLDRPWTGESVLDVMARRVGVSPDPRYTYGADRIDPALTIAGLDAAAARIAKALQNQEKVLVATGHPTGLLALYLPVVDALRSAGCEIPTPCDGRSVSGIGGPKWIRYAGDVAMLATGADFVHTHRAEPMKLMLSELGAARPDLVIADHGWAGAAADAGLSTIGFADCNDPGVFIAAEQGLDMIAVPLDDNVLATTSYRPLSDRLLALH